MECIILFINAYMKHIPLLCTYFHVILFWSGNMIIIYLFLAYKHNFKILTFIFHIYLYSYYTCYGYNYCAMDTAMCGCHYCSAVHDLDMHVTCVLDTLCSVACCWWQLCFICTLNHTCVEWIALFTVLTSAIHILRLLVLQNC
jgi:hypothetical protein